MTENILCDQLPSVKSKIEKCTYYVLSIAQ